MKLRTGLKYQSAAVFVQEIEESKEFDTMVLELAVELDYGKNMITEGGITVWEISPNHIIPEQLGVNSISDRSVSRFEFYFETEGIETVYNLC